MKETFHSGHVVQHHGLATGIQDTIGLQFFQHAASHFA
jgi:hypothetical protein